MSTTGPVGTPDELIQAAIDATGLDDFGEPTWREGLDLYVRSLGESAQLNDIGVGVARDGIVGDLSTRLRLIQWRKDHPAVAQQRIVAPIIIVGLPRTGTSILHDLMAQDPSMRAPLSWEVERPVPAPRTETYGSDPRIAEAQAGFDLVDSIIPGFTAFHELGAQLAQEDVRMWTSEFRSMQLSLQFEVPEYTAGCCTTPTWRPPTDGTTSSSSTSSPSTWPTDGCSSHPRTCGSSTCCWPSTPTRSSSRTTATR